MILLVLVSSAKLLQKQIEVTEIEDEWRKLNWGRRGKSFAPLYLRNDW